MPRMCPIFTQPQNSQFDVEGEGGGGGEGEEHSLFDTNDDGN